MAGKKDRNLLYSQWGGFLSAAKLLLQNKRKAGLVARLDKNDDFDAKANFRAPLPESIRSLEAGYRALLLKNRLFVDTDAYHSQYHSFIAQVEVSTPATRNTDSVAYALFERKTQSRYRMWTNSKTVVYNYGAALKLRADLGKGCLLDYPVMFTTLKKSERDDRLEDGFNTPMWMKNIGLSKEHIRKHPGAGILYRWQDSYYWQSFLVNGKVPAQGALDIKVNYTFPKLPLHLKAGATNLTNHYQTFFEWPAGGFILLHLTHVCGAVSSQQLAVVLLTASCKLLMLSVPNN